MSSRRPKVTAENPYGKSGLFKAILVKTRKTYSPLMIFKPFSPLRGARSVNSVSNLPLVGLEKYQICRGILRHGFSVCLLETYLRIKISFLTI